jgi:hypothetical protein
LACLFLNGANRERFKQVVNNLNNDFIQETCRKKVADEAARANGLHVQNQTNTSGWFSSEKDMNVTTSFQYDQYKARAWLQDEDD